MNNRYIMVDLSLTHGLWLQAGLRIIHVIERMLSYQLGVFAYDFLHTGRQRNETKINKLLESIFHTQAAVYKKKPTRTSALIQ